MNNIEKRLGEAKKNVNINHEKLAKLDEKDHLLDYIDKDGSIDLLALGERQRISIKFEKPTIITTIKILNSYSNDLKNKYELRKK